MRKDKEQALKLRLSGNSYSQINKKLGIPKSTLSDWFSSLEISEKARRKILIRSRQKSLAGLLKRNKNQTALAIKRKAKIRRKAKLEIPKISRQDIFFLGLSLYWGEGYKRPIKKNGRELTSHPVSLTNSDPELIKVFLRFLKEICLVPEEKIRADIRIYEHQNEEDLLSFWANATGIDKKKFGKSHYGVSKSSLGKRPFNTLPFGTVKISVNDTRLFHRIMGWIEGLKLKAVLKK
jgi:hypothetical protein